MAEPGRLPRWLVPPLSIAIASFVVPQLGLARGRENWLFLAKTGLIALVVVVAERDVVAFQLDLALLFEVLFGRLGRLANPIFAFLTICSLMASVFACLYRIVGMIGTSPAFASSGQSHDLRFGIALGFLIVQDLRVVVAVIVLSAFAATGEGGAGVPARTLAGGFVLVAAAGVLMRHAAEALLSRIAREPEPVVVPALACAAAAGLSKELGGLIAGVSLGSTSVRWAVAGRLAPLRDCLLRFSFRELGALFEVSAAGARVAEAAALPVFVIVGNPLIVMAIMGWMGDRRRTGFLAGRTAGRISEFSIVFVALGREARPDRGRRGWADDACRPGHHRALSTDMIIHSAALHRWRGPFLGPFERRRPFREDHVPEAGEVHAHEVIRSGSAATAPPSPRCWRRAASA